MGFNKWPYTNLHELNLDWVIEQLRVLNGKIESDIYQYTFAEPVEWSIARDYQARKIVTFDGASYASKKYVPVGTPITNGDYWVKILDNSAYLRELDETLSESGALNAAAAESVYVATTDYVGTLPHINGYYNQAMAYARGCLYILYFPSNEADSPREYLLKIDAETLTEIDRIVIDASSQHFTRGNSMSWNSTTNQLYICGGLGGSCKRNIVTVNLDDFTLGGYQPIAANEYNMWAGMAFDNDTNIAIATRYYSRCITSGPVNAGAVSMRFEYPIVGSGTELLQDSYAHNGKFYQALWHNTPTNNQGRFSMIRCYLELKGDNYLNVLIPLPGEIQGLTRVEDGLAYSSGDYLITFSDGTLYNIGLIPNTNMYTDIQSQSAIHTPRINYGSQDVNYTEEHIVTATVNSKTLNVVTFLPFPGAGSSPFYGRTISANFGDYSATAAFNATGKNMVFEFVDTSKNCKVLFGYAVTADAPRGIHLTYVGFVASNGAITGTTIAATAADATIRTAIQNALANYQMASSRSMWINGTDGASGYPTEFTLS